MRNGLLIDDEGGPSEITIYCLYIKIVCLLILKREITTKRFLILQKKVKVSLFFLKLVFNIAVEVDLILH